MPASNDHSQFGGPENGARACYAFETEFCDVWGRFVQDLPLLREVLIAMAAAL